MGYTIGIDKIIQVSGFGVKNTSQTQCDYILVALTAMGKVLLSRGDRDWCDVSPKPSPEEQAELDHLQAYRDQIFFDQLESFKKEEGDESRN